MFEIKLKDFNFRMSPVTKHNNKALELLEKFYEKILLVFHKVGLLQFAEFDAPEVRESGHVTSNNTTVSFCSINEETSPLRRYHFADTYWVKLDNKKMVITQFNNKSFTISRACANKIIVTN